MALLLPAIIALAVWLYGNQEQQRSSVEDSAAHSLCQIVKLTDVGLTRDHALLAGRGFAALATNELGRSGASSITPPPDARLARGGAPVGVPEPLLAAAPQEDGRPCARCTRRSRKA